MTMNCLLLTGIQNRIARGFRKRTVQRFFGSALVHNSEIVRNLFGICFVLKALRGSHFSCYFIGAIAAIASHIWALWHLPTMRLVERLQNSVRDSVIRTSGALPSFQNDTIYPLQKLITRGVWIRWQVVEYRLCGCGHSNLNLWQATIKSRKLATRFAA